MKSNCPFCDSKPRYTYSFYLRWRCGTTKSSENSLYKTGKECDLTVFRNGFLRCHDLLVDLVDGSTKLYHNGDGVHVPLNLWKKVLKEVT